MRKVIVSCALTGAGDTRKKNPGVPVSPTEIADQACEAAEAGAAVVHIHVRDPVSTLPSIDFNLYEQTVEKIRSAQCKALINLTTGPGSIFEVSGMTPVEVRPVRLANPPMSPADRITHVLRLRPSVCSLDIATFNYQDGLMLNSKGVVRAMSKLVSETAVLPELEVFDLGHIRLARHLIDAGELKGPGFFQFCLGVPWGAPATQEVIELMKSMLPQRAVWSAFGVGLDQFPVVRIAASLGGHVRVGLEDNLYLERGVLAKNNAELVRKAVSILAEADCAPASAEDACGILGAVRSP